MTLGPQPQTDLFAATRWSLVLAAAETQAGSGAHRALGELCQAYWYPLYAYARRHGNSVPQAEDAVQGFFVQLLQSRKLFATADPARGRFRAFLLGSFKNWLVGEWERQHAQKRGGFAEKIELDALTAEERYRLEPATAPADRLFDRSWALLVLDQVLARLRQDYVTQGQEKIFAALEPLISLGAEGPDYPAVAAKLGLEVNAVRVAAHRLRKRYRQRLREEIAQTVGGSETEVDDELRHLLACLD